MRNMIMGAALLMASTLPAAAWEAGFEGPVCTLTHSADAGDVRLTYDPSGPLYTITVTLAAPWPDTPLFAIAFEGGRAQTITTDRHTMSPDGRSLSVADRGFGNVLGGLANNTTATMIAGASAPVFQLDGAAPEVARFEACITAPTA